MPYLSPVVVHQRAGRPVSVAGLRTFVREEGEGEAVLCVHGVPVSSYVYRKVLPALAERGLRAIATDLPGLGLSDRPESFDYSWTGLGRHLVALVDVLELESFHLVVHDIGGPVGFELAAVLPDRVRSLTLLDTLVEVDGFRKPWSMWPFEVPGLGELWLAAMIAPAFVELMYAQGVSSRELCPPDELRGHLELLKRGDGGRAFLKIMRSFETTPAKAALYRRVVRDGPYPAQAIWGVEDPALRIDTFGAVARQLVGIDRFYTVPGKHFLQETDYDSIAERVAQLVAQT